ncbi:type I secretion system permease/ATPase [Teichococcus aerophilus]|nr:type I secretion system permease/ATPase [Pseudoroseomonas aerophila]
MHREGIVGPREASLLSRAIASCRKDFLAVGLFSGAVNLLQLTVSIYMMQVFDRVLATRSVDTLLFLTLIALGAIMLLAVLETVRSQVMQRVALWIEARVAPEGFKRALEAKLRGQPYCMEALRDLAVYRSWVSSSGALAVYDVPWIPIYLAAVFMLHPVLGFIATIGAGALFGLTLLNEISTSSLLRQASTVAQTTQRRADAIVRNAEVIDSMGMVNAVMRRWQESIEKNTKLQHKASNRAAIVLSATKFFRLAVQLAVLGCGAYLALRQDLTSGASMAASMIMGRALAPVEQLIGGWKGLVQSQQALKRLQAFLSLSRIRPPGLVLPDPKGRISFDRVTYNISGQAEPIIKGITFALEPGESLAIVGPSAAGKTTLIRMLIGTLPTATGHVRLDGADVFTWKREDFGRHVGYLPQDIEIFDGSVYLNIARMADAKPNDVFAAAKMAGCHEMILRLPQGYDTEIGEGGKHLSGGQQQLIGLARAMYGAPKLVVLDEPNSNLDGDAEATLQAAVESLKVRGATVVLVSHRPALVQVVDKVLVLRDGSIDLFGPRTEVLRQLTVSARPTSPPAQAAKFQMQGIVT